MAKATNKTKSAAHGHYVEYHVKISGGKAEKLGVSRPCVKISDTEAEALNHGVLNGGNNYAKMYFKAEGAPKPESDEDLQ